MSGKIKLNTSKVILNTDKILFGIPQQTWSFLETSANSTLYPTPRAVIVSGASGCATVGEGAAALESSFPANDQTLGRYGRVTVFDDGLVACGYFHWYTVVVV
jgi:hypothetical protein